MFFDPHNLESIMNAMREVAYSNEKRRALAQAGRVQEAKFSWDRCARDTVESYRT
jgi:glycosyltransferase involved in cell wall biosynthesis